MQPEASFKKKLDRAFDQAAKHHGWAGYRTAIEKGRGQKSGWPDRLYCVPDLGHMWVEAKVDGNKPDKLQDRVLSCISTSGMQGCTVTFYRNSECTAWCQYSSGKPFPGYAFVPLDTVQTPCFWDLLLQGKLHSEFSL